MTDPVPGQPFEGPRERVTKGPASAKEALILAIQMAIVATAASDAEEAALLTTCADQLASSMTPEEVEACKALAKAGLSLGQ